MTVDVEIEHKYFRHLLEISPGARGHISLTTLIPHQHSAVIKLFLSENSEHTFLKEYLLDLSHTGKDKPLMEVRGNVVKNILELSIAVENEVVREDTLKIPYPCRLSKRVLLFAAGGILLAALLFFGYRKISPEPQTQKGALTEKPAPAQRGGQTPVKPEEQSHLQPEAQPPVQSETQPPVKQAAVSFKKIIYFYPDSTRIKEGEEKKLQEVISFLKNHSGGKITISGFCALSGTQKGRRELSKKRAEKIATLLKKGRWLPEATLRVKWFGAQNPVTTDPAQIDKNRRVEIKIVSN